MMYRITTSPTDEVTMTTTDSSAALRDELRELEAQITELQGTVDDTRSGLAETADKSASIEAAEQQEALIAQLELRRRDLMERIESA
jgi:predicted  nucleic acid-binding Zn-ribbon protein